MVQDRKDGCEVRHYHVAVNHAGKEHTLAALRERYWIIKARVAIHAELKNCCACRRQAVKIYDVTNGARCVTD